jgi:hypothetical protein
MPFGHGCLYLIGRNESATIMMFSDSSFAVSHCNANEETDSRPRKPSTQTTLVQNPRQTDSA